MVPRITVLMPVYNAERYAARAVESILAQTWRDFEFIIVDGGSTDNTLRIIQGYAQMDDRIRILSRPNKKIAESLNEGLGIARGRYIARMDADDVSYPSRFEFQVEHLEADPECVAVGSMVRCIDENSQPIESAYIPPTEHDEIDNWFLSGNGGGIPHPAAMLRAEALARIGGYRVGLRAEDADLFLRLAEIGTLANLPHVLLDYRIHSASCTQITVEAGRMSACAAAVEAYDRRRTGRCRRRSIATIAAMPLALALTILRSANRSARYASSQAPKMRGDYWRWQFYLCPQIQRQRRRVIDLVGR